MYHCKNIKENEENTIFLDTQCIIEKRNVLDSGHLFAVSTFLTTYFFEIPGTTADNL